MSYDIFISYRRQGGFETAKHLYDLLVRDDYSVSFDIDTLREGRFDYKLYNRIDECTDFVLIVDKDCFARTLNPDFDPQNDWLRQELAYAIKQKKNIITVLIAGAQFPEKLPNDIDSVRFMNGPKYNQDYFDAFYNRLKEFFKSNPQTKTNKSVVNNLNDSGIDVTFYTDADCLIFENNKILGELSADDCKAIKFKRGTHRLRFQSKVSDDIYYLQNITIGDDVQVYDIKLKEKLLNLFVTAAEKGDDRAQYSLGYCYYYGYGVKQDYKQAVKWYRKAAEKGNEQAECNLGNCYCCGHGVEQDYKQAVEWYRKAAEMGNEQALLNLGYLYYKGYGVEQDYKQAVEWFRKAAEKGNEQALCNLGNCYCYGYGVEQDYKQAVKWFRKAAEKGSTSAFERLKELEP